MEDAKVRELYLKLERRICGEFARFSLSHHQQLVATVIAEQSLGRGFPSVRVPRLQDIGDFLGLERQKIHSAVQKLVNMRILELTEASDCTTYRINCRSQQWQVTPRRMPQEIRRARQVLEQWNPADRISQHGETIRGICAELGLTPEGEPAGENSDGGKRSPDSGFVVLDLATVIETVAEE